MGLHISLYKTISELESKVNEDVFEEVTIIDEIDNRNNEDIKSGEVEA